MIIGEVLGAAVKHAEGCTVGSLSGLADGSQDGANVVVCIGVAVGRTRG